MHRPSSLVIPQAFSPMPPRPSQYCGNCLPYYSPQVMPMTYMMPLMYPPQNSPYMEPQSPMALPPEPIPSVYYDEPIEEKRHIVRIRHFEETNWTPVGKAMNKVQDFWINRENCFQKSVELPNGKLISFCLVKMNEMGADFRQRNFMRSRVLLKSVIRSPGTERSEDDQFEQILFVPPGTDLDSINYKLITKHVEAHTETNYNDKLRNASTTDDVFGDELPMEEANQNMVLVTGKFYPVASTPKSSRIWTKQYRHSVSGRLDVSATGQFDPIINTFSELPDYVAEHNSTPDRDTNYSLLSNSCQIRIHLDENVDQRSIKVITNEKEEKIKVNYSRHIHKDYPEISQGGLENGGTDFDLKVNQVFQLSSNKFDIPAIRHKIEDSHLVINAPFRNVQLTEPQEYVSPQSDISIN